MSKEILVAFIDQKVKDEFETLARGKYEDEQLHKFLLRAISDLKENPFCGTKLPKRVWPRIYIEKYGVNNLWKYDLPKAWRLIYTIKEDEVRIVNIILEWFDHKAYEKRFRY